MANTTLYRTGDVVRIADLGSNGIVTRTMTYPDGMTVYSVTALDGTVYSREAADLRDVPTITADALRDDVRTIVEHDADPYGRLTVAYAVLMAKLSRTTVHPAPVAKRPRVDITGPVDLLDVISEAVGDRCEVRASNVPDAHPGSRFGRWTVVAESGLSYTITIEEN